MSTLTQLLDTPQKISLQSQSTQLRAALKDFERTFAADNDGRKPSKDDIRADVDVATNYKEYNRIRDVLAGKIDYATWAAPPKSPVKGRRHERSDSGVSWTPRKKSYNDTPRRALHPSHLDPYDRIKSSSPKTFLLQAIGPTPQRDGKVLGLFDLLSNPAGSSRMTPASRKRKLDALTEESPETLRDLAMAQTPSRRRGCARGDLLDHLTGAPCDTPETGNRKRSRTPVSEGRKFMLSQFFATPSTARYSNVDTNLIKQSTPLRERVLGMTPERDGQPLQPGPDATPAYLRRSTSFKDRLLSASRTTSNKDIGLMSPPKSRAGPPTLRHLRPVLARALTFAEPDISDFEEDEHDDDMEALREMEDSQVNVLVKDSQLQSISEPNSEAEAGRKNDQPLQKVWKKKGQKRTTRRAIMRPARGKVAQAPKFVAAEERPGCEEDISQIDETQVDGLLHKSQPIDTDVAAEDESYLSPRTDGSDSEQEAHEGATKLSEDKMSQTTKKSKKAGMINPNATSHMNFRSLKIKNKNSKAKGRGKFGRSRR